EPAAPRRHGIERIVEKRIGWLGSGRFGRERAVAICAVGAPAAMQIIAPPLRAGQRPFLLLAPLVQAHHVDSHWRAASRAVLFAFEPNVEEIQLTAIEAVRD